jgi:maleate cis-trans isomerase
MPRDPIRTRLGVILPMDNAVLEPEFSTLGLQGTASHVVRLTTPERSRMPEQGIEFSTVFNELGVDAIGYACAETSLLGGIDANEHIAREIAAATGRPAVTAIGAMVEALEALTARRVAVVAPYRRSSAEALADYLTSVGLEVVDLHHRDFSIEGSDPREWFLTNRQPPEVVADMARQVNRSAADAVVISATNVWTLPVLHALEQEFRMPVISSNSALFWALLARASATTTPFSNGRLGSQSLEAPSEIR